MKLFQNWTRGLEVVIYSIVNGLTDKDQPSHYVTGEPKKWGGGGGGV